MGLQPSPIGGGALEADAETFIGTELTVQETTERRALSLVEDQGSVPGLELCPVGIKTKRNHMSEWDLIFLSKTAL